MFNDLRPIGTLVLLLFFWLPVAAFGHQNSIDFLYLDQTNGVLKGEWHIPLHGLDALFGLDSNGDGNVNWEEVRAQLKPLQDYALAGLTLRQGDHETKPVLDQLSIQTRVTGPMLALSWHAPVLKSGDLSLRYDFQFNTDPRHQCVLVYRDRTASLSAGERVFTFEAEPPGHGFATFLREGIVHIFFGLDHICFLLALMLPAVWRRTQTGWEAVASFRSALISIAKIVTAFTLAHSVTLALAALRLVVMPSAVVESVIAFSVVAAALNNIWPLWTDRSWMVAFGFGLIHGFGFASALAGLPSGAASLAVSLAGFNCGVELGQLGIVLVFLPFAFLLREGWFYRWCAVRAGSIAIASIAAIWFVERAFQLTIF